MKDRFRFRAWNDKVRFVYFGPDYCNGCEWWDFPDAIKDKEWIVEQCTGLKDKNGTLIYEGDIVRKDLKQDFKGDSTTPSYYCDCSCIGIVAFNASTGYFMKNAKVFLTLNKNKPKKLQDKILKRTRLCAKRCTIIGNVHENPELLER